jgi:hypothetical protein
VIPCHRRLYEQVLQALADGKPHKLAELGDGLAEMLNLSEHEAAQPTHRGGPRLIDYRALQAAVAQVEAGNVELVKGAGKTFQITGEGIKRLQGGKN